MPNRFLSGRVTAESEAHRSLQITSPRNYGQQIIKSIKPGVSVSQSVHPKLKTALCAAC